MAGWQIIRKTGDQETPFKFHRSVKIEGNGYVTVWSADSGATHEPPQSIVMVSKESRSAFRTFSIRFLEMDLGGLLQWNLFAHAKYA